MLKKLKQINFIKIIKASITALFALTLFSPLATAISNETNKSDDSSYTKSLIELSKGGQRAWNTGYDSTLETGATPSIIYTVPTLPDPFDNNNGAIPAPAPGQPPIIGNIHQILAFNESLRILGLNTADVESNYEQSLTNIISYNYSGYPANGFNSVSKFTQDSQAFEGYKIINQLDDIDKTKKLKITRPAEAYDVFSSNTVIGGVGSTVTIPTDFFYKVAEVDLKNIPEFEPIAFTIKDTNDTDQDNSDYELILANDNNILKNLTSSKPFSLKELIAMDMIFIRDNSSGNVYDFENGVPSSAASAKQFDDVVYMKYQKDSAGDISKIDIFIKPTSTTNPVEFGISSSTIPDARGSIKFGILDNSLSPLHTRKVDKFEDGGLIVRWPSLSDPVDPAKIMLDTGVTEDVISSYQVRSGASNWKEETNYVSGGNIIDDGEHLRFYLAPGTKFEEELKFNKKGSDVFEGQNNKLAVEFGAGGADISFSPQRIIITSEEYSLSPRAVSPISISLSPLEHVVAGETIRWMQVDMVLQRNIMQVNPDVSDPDTNEANYIWPITTERVFFEPPSVVAPNTDLQATQQTINVEPKTEVADIYKDVLGNVFANWSGIITPDNDNYIQPNPIWFPDAAANPGESIGVGGLPSYLDVQYQDYYSDALTGQVIDKREVFNNLYEQDPTTGIDQLDANGDRQPIAHTGSNILTRLNEYSDRLSKWLREKYGYSILNGVREEGHYKLEDPSSKISFVQKRIVDSAGPEGQLLAVASDAIVRYWSGGSLTEDQNKIINDMNTFIRERNLPWDLKTDVLDFNKKGINNEDPDFSTPGYKNSKQIVFHLIELYLDNALSALFDLEKKTFDNFRSGVLREHMGEYLINNNAESIAIPLDLTFNIEPEKITSTSADLTGLNLIYLKRTAVATSSSGIAELGSLLAFIFNNNLQSRYLTTDEKQSFNGFYGNGDGDILNPDAYDSNNNQALKSVRDMISLLDKILSEILGDEAQSLNKIISDIEEGVIDTSGEKTGQSEIRSVVQDSIKKIVSKNNTFTYQYFGGSVHTESTYIQNLVVGRNIESILNLYLTNNAANISPDDSNIIRSKLGAGSYQVENIVQLAVNLGYYNIEYFVRGLTDENIAPIIALDMISSNLANSLSLEVPEGNELVQAISNPDLMTKISLFGAGGVLVFVSMFGLGSTFRKKVRQSSGKSIIITQVIFGIMLVIAAAIVGGGLLI